MFYSHEVLTSRKYGVATVWLVATLGSKSSLKKVSRKAILDVDVQKACETIVTPQAPMALRLQSNLLYGVARVYAQQCTYVLGDAETASKDMRSLLNLIKGATLDVEGANKARAEQLMLQDDPNYLPDFDLVPLDLDRLDIDMTTKDDSQHSRLSPHNSQLSGGDLGTQYNITRLDIPHSVSSSFGGPVGGARGFSIQGDSGAGSRVDIRGLDDDLGFIVGDDGNMQIFDDPVRQAREPSLRGETTDFGVGEEGGAQLGQDTVGRSDDDVFLPLQDDYDLAPEHEPLDPRSNVQPTANGEVQPQKITSEESAEAPIRRRNASGRKIIPLDSTMELRNHELASWHSNYVGNMLEAIRLKAANKATAIAKKNAEYWMLGTDDDGPLSIFSGAKLFQTLTGIDLGVRGQKRPRDEADEPEEPRRVRSRGEPSSDDIARGFQDDGYMPMMGDDTIEQGRDAPTPLDDRHISSMMPWNQSAGSRQAAGAFSAAGMPSSASFGGPLPQFGSLPRRPSRLTSASPLLGRGTGGGDVGELHLPDLQDDTAMTGLDDFEIFGPAAQVDTQTAEQSQWQRAALDNESEHFLEFVQTGIEEMVQARDQAGLIGDEDESQRTIDFEALLPPANHTCIVAAQALLHVLALGTKDMLAIEQQEPFGPITMRVLAAR